MQILGLTGAGLTRRPSSWPVSVVARGRRRRRVRGFVSPAEAARGRDLAVSHGTLIRILLCEFLGSDARLVRRLKVSN